MDKTLSRITSLIDTYESGEYVNLERLTEAQRELSISNRGTKSVAAAKVEADEKVPELRMLRKIMDAVNQVLWSVRSEISIIKKES